MATTLEQLKQAKSTWEFTAPPFANGVELVVELREPSIMAMMYDDGVSNPLLNDVEVLTGVKNKNNMTAEQRESAKRFVRNVVEYCLVSPTMEQIDKAAGGLSDIQLLAIYREVIKSTENLSSFRTETTDN